MEMERIFCPQCGRSGSNITFISKRQGSFLTSTSTVYLYECICGTAFVQRSLKSKSEDSIPFINLRSPHVS